MSWVFGIFFMLVLENSRMFSICQGKNRFGGGMRNFSFCLKGLGVVGWRGPSWMTLSKLAKLHDLDHKLINQS